MWLTGAILGNDQISSFSPKHILNLSSEGLSGEPAAPAGPTQGRDPIRSRGARQRNSIYARAQDTRTQLHAEGWEAEGRRHQRPGAHTAEERVRGSKSPDPVEKTKARLRCPGRGEGGSSSADGGRPGCGTA